MSGGGMDAALGSPAVLLSKCVSAWKPFVYSPHTHLNTHLPFYAPKRRPCLESLKPAAYDPQRSSAEVCAQQQRAVSRMFLACGLECDVRAG